MVTKMPIFDPQMTRAVCDVLGATDYPGLTATTLNDILWEGRLELEDGSENKRTRLFATLHNAQVRQNAGNALVVFLRTAMTPARYVSDHELFIRLQDQLNERLSLYGYRIDDQGRLARGARATTLSEAAQLAGELSADLRRRGCHPVLFTYCSEELVRRSLFHAIEEAAKSIPDRLRRHTGLGTDGDDLYGAVFGSRNAAPRVQINSFRTDSEMSEHRGFKNLLTGIHGHYRNPRTHATRHGSSEDKQDFLDAFALFSYIHRRLDSAGVAN